MQTIVSINKLNKTYRNGHQALKNLNLEIKRGEILALLGPNGAGKTTLISIICGIVNASSGQVIVDGHDIATDFRQSRRKIGLVPQELTLGAFDKVRNTLRFSRGLFGKKPDAAYLKTLLQDLSLWDKRDNEILSLSGGMKRRVLIAKALAHEPDILFLDEPTAGVDVELRKDMWAIVRRLRESGVTIILTTHYIEEAEEIADRVGVINNGELLLIDEKTSIMHKLGEKQMVIELSEALHDIPAAIRQWDVVLNEEGSQLTYTYDAHEPGNINELFDTLRKSDVAFNDINTSQSSLEEIFVNLVKER